MTCLFYFFKLHVIIEMKEIPQSIWSIPIALQTKHLFLIILGKLQRW